jgi:APA family basic amino acid/polyamine antiporter
LKKCLTAWDLVLYGVGSSVGAGIYSLIGVGAKEAGPSISLSFLFCGLACIFTSLSYSEFAARVPIAGSAYTFVYASFGEFAAWLIGWNLTLGYGVSAAVVARSWAEYLSTFVGDCGGVAPAWLTSYEIMGHTCNPLAPVILLLCTAVLCVGVKESTKFNAYMTIMNLCVLMFVVVAGGPRIDSTDNLVPFAPEGTTGVAKGAGLVFFAYLGFDMVACLSEEVKDPQTNMPKGIIGSLVISMCIYTTLSIVIVGMAPIDILGDKTPISNAFLANACCTDAEMQLEDNSCLKCADEDVLSNVMFYGSKVINFGAMFGLTTACFTCLMGQPRIFYRMAKDGLLFKVFGVVNAETNVPVFGTIMTGLMVSAVAFSVDLTTLANMISLGTLQVFTFVNAGVIVLRTSRPDVSSNKVPMLILAFSACILLASLSVKSKFGGGLYFFVPILLVGGALACTLTLMSVPRARPPNSFRCPWVPFIPLCGIACNVYMMGSLDASDWVHIGAWLMVGVFIYFSYGIWNSALREKSDMLLGSDVVGSNDDNYSYGGLVGEDGEKPLIGVGETSSSGLYDGEDGGAARKKQGIFSF